MNTDFNNWLLQNGLTEVFTTYAKDTFYVNVAKKFGVLKKNGEYRVKSFYLDDVVGLQIYDDERLTVEWDPVNLWRMYERYTQYSMNELQIRLRLKNQQWIRIQVVKCLGNNIRRDSAEHVNMLNYACQIAQQVCRSVSETL